MFEMLTNIATLTVQEIRWENSSSHARMGATALLNDKYIPSETAGRKPKMTGG